MKIPPRFRSILFLFLGAVASSAAVPVIAKLIELGKEYPINGRNPVSFCSVLFAGNIIALLALLSINSTKIIRFRPSKVKLKHWLLSLVAAVLSGFLAPTLYFLGIQFANVVNVVLISALTIPFDLIIGRLFFREKLKLGVMIGALITVIGVGVTAFLQKHEPHVVEQFADIPLFHFLNKTPGAGEICVFFAVMLLEIDIFLSRYTIHSMPKEVYNIFRVGVGAFIFFWLAWVLFGAEHFIDLLSPFLWQWMVVYGVFIVALDIYFSFMGLLHAEAAEIAIAAASTPISSLIFAFFILGAIPTAPQWIGGSITIFGILYALVFKLRNKENVILQNPICFRGI